MKQFTYTITDKLGLHARPASLLVTAANNTDSVITITRGNDSALASSLMMIMGMSVEYGDEITITIEGGSSEEMTYQTLKKLLVENL